MRRLRSHHVIAAAAAVLVALVILLAWLAGIGPWASDERSERPAPSPDAAPGNASGSSRVTPAAPGLTPTATAHGGAEASDTPAPASRSLFEGDCFFGVEATCLEWKSLAEQCDERDADACEQLGSLLIGESPMQPLWGALALGHACRLGRDDACERHVQWQDWSKFGYRNKPIEPGDLPDGLVEACAGGDQAACGLIQMRSARGRGDLFDWDTALAACRAGFRDLCSAMLDVAETTAQLLAALSTGCDIPDARLCLTLADHYAECPVAGRPCPPPNPRLAAQYRELGCRLAPAIPECGTSP